MYGYKYSCLILKIYGYEGSCLILINVWLHVFLSNINKCMVTSIPV